jgi:peptidoglycan/LPS O-acetylase OafA/YrhL
LEYIDGLRALAALWVALHHAIETSEPTWAMNLPIFGHVVRSLFFGQFPVMVFLMLSGFCLYYPCVKKNPTAPQITTSFRIYMARRYTRIAPPYLWAGAFCLALAAVPALQVGRWLIVTPIDWKVVLSHLLMVHNLIPSHANKIDYPMWSIGLEFQLYLLFPLLVWGARRLGSVPVFVASLLVAAVIRGTYRRLPLSLGAILHDGPFSYLEIFVLGMLAAALTVRGNRLAPNWVLATVAVVGFAVVRVGSGNGLAHDLATSGATFAVLLLAADSRSAVARVLSAAPLVRIGVFSYSIYLVHAPLLHLFWLAQRPARLSPDACFALLAFVALPLIVLVAYGFHCLFERPFMRVSPVKTHVALAPPAAQ